MRAILALTGKDLRLLLRDKAGFFFVFFFPLLYAIFFGMIFSGAGGGSHPISILIVDEDSTTGSRDFFKKLSDAAELRVRDTTRAAAENLVRRGKKSAYVVLKPGFGAARENLFWGQGAEIEIGLDPSRKAEAGILEGVLTRYYMEDLMKPFQDPKLMQGQLRKSVQQIEAAPDSEQKWFAPLKSSLQQMGAFFEQVPDSATADCAATAATATSAGWQPLKVSVNSVAVQWEGPKNSFEVTFPQAVLWGMLGCAAAFGISLVVERSKGTLVRLRLSPLSRRQILAGKALACFIATFSVSLLLFGIAYVIFHVVPYSLPLLLLALASASLCFVGIMMFLSVLGKTEAAASGIGWAVLMVMAMVGGGMIPHFFMPGWLQTISHFSPVKWAIVTMEGAVWRGFTPGVMLTHCLLLLAIGAVFFTIGAKIFSWSSE